MANRRSPAPTTVHSHSNNCQEELSNKYAEYVDSHLEDLRTKCKHINTCIDTLLENENILVVINGYNLRLNKTCSLVYKSSSESYGNFSGKCTSEDRDDIRNDVEQHLKSHIEGRNSGWKSIKTCLDNSYGDIERSSYVDEICGLAYNKTTICGPGNSAHKTVEDFVNDQIHHLKCTCRALQINEDNHVSLPILIGAAVGGVLLLLALFIIGFICYRRRKTQKRKKKSPNVIYLQAPNSDNSPVYQEIFDDKAYQSYGRFPSGNPPKLPIRYETIESNRSNLQITGYEDDQGYLEPVAASSRLRPRLPLPGKTNPNYGAPPEYRETDGGTDAENGYIEALPSPAEDENKGYNTIGKNKPVLEQPAPDYSTEETVIADVPQSDSVKLGPVPAKRTKKDDRQAESHYFVLEQDDDGGRENSSV